MWWLYLDESGDLGFDFVNKKPSRFFTVCILATSCRETNSSLKRSINRTLKNKVNPPGKRKRIVEELKGSTTEISVKKYAWNQLESARFGIYSVTLNKKRVYDQLTQNKERVYNFISRQVIDQIPFEKAQDKIQLIVDKSKNKYQIKEFNEYIRQQLEGRVSPKCLLYFTHEDSKVWPGLQWADMFAWGIFRKYEKRDTAWSTVYKKKINFDEQYL